MDNKTLEIGKIVSTHGLKGEVKVTPWCDDPQIFARLKTVSGGGRAFDIEGVKFQKNNVILKLSAVDRIEDAETMRDCVLSIERAALGSLPDDTYYVEDLLGMSVFLHGELLGKITDWFATGGNDVYVVRGEDGKQHLIPAIRQVVKGVDIEGRRMDIALIEGLLDEG